MQIRRKEARDPQTGKICEHALAGRMRLRKLPNKSAASIDKLTEDCIASGAIITTDDGTEYTNLKARGYALANDEQI